MGSSIIFESCKFENAYHSKGGIVYIEESNITFVGHNVFFNNTVNCTAGAMYGLRSQIQLSGNNTFMGNRVEMENGHNCDGTAIHVEFSNISLNGYFKFHNNQLISYSYWNNHGGTISASFSSINMLGVLYFTMNSNTNGGAILLHNTQCLICGHVEFEGNEVFSDGGVIRATCSSLILNSNELYSYNNFEYLNSESSSTLYLKSVILFCNNSAQGWGGAVDLLETSMSLTGSVIFMANKALQGGGMSIFYYSGSRKCNLNVIFFFWNH